MNIASRLCSRAGRFLARLLATSMSVWMLGVIYTPALASVTVDQQPLIIQKAVAPNITLMLDDSGSMAWDFMPDAGYLTNATTDGNGDTHVPLTTLLDSALNGTYYNPAVTYSPPPKAALKSDGSTDYYAASPGLGSAFIDGIQDQSAADEVDVTQYASSSLCDYNNYDMSQSTSNPCPNAFYQYFTYGTTFQTGTTTSTSTSTSTYAPTLKCTIGTLQYSGSHKNMCKSGSGSGATYTSPTLTCNSGDTLDSNSLQCVHTTTTTTTTPVYTSYFTYEVAGVAHYVAKNAGDCAAASLSASVCSESAADQQNVANWFSYYRTRILMAKSGLMTAFSTIDSTFRIGFGSINGTNNSNLPSLTFTANSKKIAEVEPFGDGTSSTQKGNFWTWVAGINPNNSTPLRLALDAVGQYYSDTVDQQAWKNSDTDSAMLACRLSYTILTTDGFWNESNPPNVGNVDGTSATSAITGVNGQSYTYSAVAPYSDTYNNTLADVAMKYWSTDLQPSIDNEVPTSTPDPAFWQHMTTFTLGLGFKPTGIKPSGTTIDQIFNWANGGTSLGNSFSWPQPASNSINNIADLAHAAVNGHGGFYSATSPQAFTSGLQNALSRAAERVGTGASLAANSTQLQTGTVAYQANYYTVQWKGDLQAFAVNSTTGAYANAASWTAASSMPAYGSRSIYTYNPTTAAMVTFSSPTSLSTAEQAALGADATSQQNMINYLRGDSSKDQKHNGAFRSRDTALGDIVNSQPMYSGAPTANQFSGQTFSGSTSFATYASNKASREALLWVAANDGMLHAFDAGTGVEKFAYVPAAVVTNNLISLSDPNYGSASVPHQFFNDGQLTIADAYLSSDSAWHTVLVGTTGRGTAKAVYALDITDPTSIKFLWERSAGDGNSDGNSKYIGQMSGQPIIAQTADGTWSVLMGNGYNSASGVSALLQFNLPDGALNVHVTTDASTSNGLAEPAVWLGTLGNGVSTTAYAGDLNGQVWSFTLNTGSASTTATPTSKGVKLFTAKDSLGNAQPITGGMLAGKNPATGDLWLLFGTGQYLSSSDLTNKNVQSWYGLIVQTGTTGLPALSAGRSSLKQRFIVAETAGSTTGGTTVLPARVVTPAPTTPDMANESGWYMDLESPTGTGGAYVDQGERMVTPSQFQGSLLLGTTRIPKATDLCNPSGAGWIMAVDPFTGTNPSGNFFDLNGDGAINSSDMVTYNGHSYAAAGVGFVSLPNNPIFVGGDMLVTTDNGNKYHLNTSSTVGTLRRVSWRELISP
ncbi:pilus assembly protein [Dyella subtropica]|uniref:pilus assembly protein n=1 Tax=Dyella subtropica TaxID=2992127 RepID=UPI002255E0C0|nr:PilC/PilY family type IV pilus protein [Dyella subtropica]